MKQLLLFFLLLFVFSSLQAQISITKRKHRGGFHIETNFNRNKVAKQDKYEVKEVFVPKAHSANEVQLTQKEVTSVQSENTIEASLRLPNYKEQKSHKALKTTPKWLASKYTYLPSGAALMKKITDPPKKEVKNIRAKNTFATIGFFLGVFTFAATLAAVMSGFVFYFSFLIVLGSVPGLVFSLLGLKSKYRKSAIIGLLLSSVVMAFSIILFLLILEAYSYNTGY